MFIGHFAVGLAAKSAAPRTSLTMLVLAACLADVLFPLLSWTGLETVRIAPGDTVVMPMAFDRYPWSHSLLMGAVWAALIVLLYRWRTRYTRGAVVLALAVLSHWVLDVVSHRPDVPLAPGLPVKLGLGLWNSVAGTVLVETALFVVGVYLYVRATRAKSWVGHVALWSVVALLAFGYFSDMPGHVPPSVATVRIVNTALLALFAWFVWIDRTRVSRTPLPASA